MQTLSSYRDEQAQARQRLVEGIAHIESLPIEKFVDAVEHLDRYVATEKLDGYNLWFGVDDRGFYTSRGSKGGQVFRSVDDYDNRPATNAFKAVHTALEKDWSVISQHINEGDCVEIEVLYGRQPNAIVYGDNYIVFLRSISGVNDASLDQLAMALKDRVTTVTVSICDTTDGSGLEAREETSEWRYGRPSKMDPSKVMSDERVTTLIDKLETFLSSPNTDLPAYTNRDILEIDPSTVEADLKAGFLRAKEDTLMVVVEQYKMPIKAVLVDILLRRTASPYQTAQLTNRDVRGIEGIVFLDPETNEQFKLVDKDVFTIINRFNFAVRSIVKSTGPGKIQHVGNIDLHVDHVLFDKFTTGLAVVLQMAQRMKYYEIKRVLRQFGKTPNEIVSNLSATITDLNLTKRQLVTLIGKTIQEVEHARSLYLKEWKTYKIKLPNGSVAAYTPDVHKRTLLTFGETKEYLATLADKIKTCKTAAELITVLFSKQLSSLTAK